MTKIQYGKNRLKSLENQTVVRRFPLRIIFNEANTFLCDLKKKYVQGLEGGMSVYKSQCWSP